MGDAHAAPSGAERGQQPDERHEGSDGDEKRGGLVRCQVWSPTDADIIAR
jgi:hypothetical protein